MKRRKIYKKNQINISTKKESSRITLLLRTENEGRYNIILHFLHKIVTIILMVNYFNL